MTEAEWLACDHPRRLFRWLQRSGATDYARLGALFVACCDLIPPEIAQHPPPAVQWATDSDSQLAITDVDFHLGEAVLEAMRSADRGTLHRATLVSVVRDIFDNPFRPVTFDPAWRTDTAVALARQMYETREFGAMPILADALQDAGCEDEHILSHCRDTSAPHVRGCWVCDLVLAKL